jgi:hypothetical protein
MYTIFRFDAVFFSGPSVYSLLPYGCFSVFLFGFSTSVFRFLAYFPVFLPVFVARSDVFAADSSVFLHLFNPKNPVLLQIFQCFFQFFHQAFSC